MSNYEEGPYQVCLFPATHVILDSLCRPDVCLRQSLLVIGQFGCSCLPPSDANFGKGEGAPLKVNVKIFQVGTTF